MPKKIAEFYNDSSSFLNGDVVISGSLAFTGNILNNLTATGKIFNSQATHVNSQSIGPITLTSSNLFNGIFEITQTVPVLLTLPTGTNMYNIGISIDQSIDWTVINTGTASGTATVQANTGHTMVGQGFIQKSLSGRFRTRITALNTAITYRLS